jgi:hypothetical protein
MRAEHIPMANVSAFEIGLTEILSHPPASLLLA